MSGSTRQDPNVAPVFFRSLVILFRLRFTSFCRAGELASNPAFLAFRRTLPCGFQARALRVVVFNQFHDFGLKNILRGVNCTQGFSKLLLF